MHGWQEFPCHSLAVARSFRVLGRAKCSSAFVDARYDFTLLNKILLCFCPFDSLTFIYKKIKSILMDAFYSFMHGAMDTTRNNILENWDRIDVRLARAQALLQQI